MANTFTLSDIKTATERKLGPTTIVLGDDDEVQLPSVYRLGKKDREAVTKALEELDKLDDLGETEDDTAAAELLIEAISEVLRNVSPDAQKLIDAAASEDPLLTASILGDILGKWMTWTSAGEA